MTGTPPAAPKEPSGDNPAGEGGHQYPPRSGQHQHPQQENPEPPPHSAATGTSGAGGRHGMPGLAGYPQFEGPGAAHYGNEPLEPPPPLNSPTGAPVSSGYSQSGGAPQGGYPQQPGYGTQGGYPQQGGYAPQGGSTQQGAYPSQGANPQQGTYAQQSGQSPQGGYPPPGSAPQQGGFPPGAAPAQGGAPADPPPPAPGGAAAAAYDTDRLDVGRALGYGWDRFRLNPIAWMGMVLIGLIAWLMVTLLVNLLDVQSLAGVLLLFAVASLVVWLLQAAMIRGALSETDGTPPDFPTFFAFDNAGRVLVTALIVFVAGLVASLACVLPAVIVGVLCMFSLHFVIDHDLSPIDAIKASAQLVIRNPLPVIVLALAVLVMTFFGALLCGLGLLVAGPVSAIAVTYAYRTLTGGLVAWS